MKNSKKLEYINHVLQGMSDRSMVISEHFKDSDDRILLEIALDFSKEITLTEHWGDAEEGGKN